MPCRCVTYVWIYMLPHTTTHGASYNQDHLYQGFWQIVWCDLRQLVYGTHLLQHNELWWQMITLRQVKGYRCSPWRKVVCPAEDSIICAGCWGSEFKSEGSPLCHPPLPQKLQRLLDANFFIYHFISAGGYRCSSAGGYRCSSAEVLHGLTVRVSVCGSIKLGQLLYLSDLQTSNLWRWLLATWELGHASIHL